MAKELNATSYKDEFLSKLNWVESRGSCVRSDSDVSVTVNIQDKKRDRNYIAFTFRNGTAQILSNTNYVQICAHKNRIFFRESSMKEGYKLTFNVKNSERSNTEASQLNRYLKVSINTDTYKAFEGDYDLKYDDFLELYYIEKEA